ncbi:MAG TPA: DEAD/DEAH box helicase, partial [Moraxellaceae bacterium]|nr:DEAD/DEAH box helicase [Moraxellaceae bacterium]
MSFSSLNLHESVQRALAAAGYTEPTPVQAEAIPAALERRDLIVSAQTGTGKTAAFMLPALSMIADESRKPGRGPRVLVLTPTRELAQQVTTAAQKYGSELKGLRTVSVLGGMPFPAQNRLLARPYDIMVATPGRLLDHIGRGRIVFERLDMLVLDEADRMLDMGFIEDVEAIAAACPPERQTLFFSATFEDRIASLAASLLKNPHRIDIAGHQTKHESIEQKAYFADDQDHKKKLLMHMLSGVDVNQAIVFAGTRVDADALADELAQFGFPVDSLHGDMKQTSRNRTLTGLRTGRTKVLVATDVAARGIDVPGISHVINYDLPKNAEDYVHRIGRTGRAGRSGTAASLVGPRDRSVLRRIEHFLQQKIDIETIEGLEPQKRYDPDRPRRGHDKPRWGHKDRTARDDREKRFSDRERQPRREGFGDRPANGDNFAPRAAREGFSERQPRSFDRQPRPDGERQPRDFGDRQPRNFGDRQPRFDGERPQRSFQRDDRKFDKGPRAPRNDDNIGNRQDFDERQPRIEGDFGEYQRRDFMARTGLGGKGGKPGNAGGPRKARPQGGFNGNGHGYGGERRGFAPRNEGGFRDERPQRDHASKPAVQVQTKRRRFGEDASR